MILNLILINDLFITLRRHIYQYLCYYRYINIEKAMIIKVFQIQITHIY